MVWSSPERVVLDLSRLSLMDASDLRTVLALERQSVQQNARLELVAGPGDWAGREPPAGQSGAEVRCPVRQGGEHTEQDRHVTLGALTARCKTSFGYPPPLSWVSIGHDRQIERAVRRARVPVTQPTRDVGLLTPTIAVRQGLRDQFDQLRLLMRRKRS
jgi:hypothetical protein